MISNEDGLLNRVVLGKYLILGRLSEGSLGAIYLGRDEMGAGRPVFVKAIAPLHLKSEEATQQFASEARRLVGITGPHLAAVLDAGGQGTSQLVVTEYVPGYDLGHWAKFVQVKRGEMPIGVAVHVVVEALAGLQALHDGGILHREVVPSNIVLDAGGHAWVTDFGLSRLVAEGTAVIDPTLDNKLAYQAPELVTRSQPGPPADIYGAALVLYELLTRENPFARGNLPMTLSAVMREEPPPVKSKRRDLHDTLADAIDRSLKKDPDKRPSTAAELIAVLSPFATGGREAASMIGGDFVDPAILEIKPVIALEERDRLLASAGSIEARPAEEARSTRRTASQKARARRSTAGELVVQRNAHESGVVWRQGPASAPPPVPTSRSPVVVIAIAVIGLSIAAVIALLVLR